MQDHILCNTTCLVSLILYFFGQPPLPNWSLLFLHSPPPFPPLQNWECLVGAVDTMNVECGIWCVIPVAGFLHSSILQLNPHIAKLLKVGWVVSGIVNKLSCWLNVWKELIPEMIPLQFICFSFRPKDFLFPLDGRFYMRLVPNGKKLTEFIIFFCRILTVKLVANSFVHWKVLRFVPSLWFNQFILEAAELEA